MKNEITVIYYHECAVVALQNCRVEFVDSNVNNLAIVKMNRSHPFRYQMEERTVFQLICIQCLCFHTLFVSSSIENHHAISKKDEEASYLFSDSTQYLAASTRE